MKNSKGIDLLRYAVTQFDSCEESFNQRWNADQLLRIASAMRECAWDFSPDQWEERQLQECIQSGTVPKWDHRELPDGTTRIVPVYEDNESYDEFVPVLNVDGKESWED